MQNQVTFSVLIFAAVIVGTVIGIVFTIFWHNFRSNQFRAKYDIPDIMGEWQCQWFDDAKESGEPKVQDTVRIQKWIGDGEFRARGYQPQFHLSYPIFGEIDPSRVVTLIYKAARYPYEPNRGIACLQLSRDGKSMEGRWIGRRSSGQLGGGMVKFLRVADSNVASQLGS